MTRLPGALFTVFPPGGAPARQCARPTGPGDQGAALSQLCACSFGDPLTLTRLRPAPRPQRGLEACRPVAGTEACGARGSLRPLSPRLGSREKQDGANPSAGDISAGRGPSEPPAAGSRVGDLQGPCWSAGRGTHGLSVPGALAFPDAPEFRYCPCTSLPETLPRTRTWVFSKDGAGLPPRGAGFATFPREEGAGEWDASSNSYSSLLL